MECMQYRKCVSKGPNHAVRLEGQAAWLSLSASGFTDFYMAGGGAVSSPVVAAASRASNSAFFMSWPPQSM
jgi:hypothetical protein